MNEQRIKVLLIDDDDSKREMYAEIFSDAGFDVMEARDGVDGLDIATKEIPNVIFTGIIMPRMDGFTLMEALRKNVSTANIPVIIHSHMGREEDQQRANMLGAKDFVVRGMTSPVKVVEKIKNLVVNKGVTYTLEINPNSAEMRRLAKDFNLNAAFQCLDCKKSQLVMEIRLLDPQENTFQARFLCPHCGWVAK
jgi:CheY-like chemotaxis protein